MHVMSFNNYLLMHESQELLVTTWKTSDYIWWFKKNTSERLHLLTSPRFYTILIIPAVRPDLLDVYSSVRLISRKKIKLSLVYLVSLPFWIKFAFFKNTMVAIVSTKISYYGCYLPVMKSTVAVLWCNEDTHDAPFHWYATPKYFKEHHVHVVP